MKLRLRQRERERARAEMECCRANRSDVHLSAEEESQKEQQTRDYFDGVVPKRHTKPQRSDYSNLYVDNVLSDDTIPELTEFHRLQHDDPHTLVCTGTKASEEFVETEYYQDLNCVDKQHHHTTGTGYIKMEGSNNKPFSLTPDTDDTVCASSHGNPATNDWIPAPAHLLPSASNKPKRSDN